MSQGNRAPFVVAHRGASGTRPEHTLAAYEQALEEGADGVECDVRLTRDGHLVCVHDRTVDRTSSGTGLVSEMT
ncbi:glycerophosphodiester phosphodiesterase family protein, partial [Nocardia farcinica]